MAEASATGRRKLDETAAARRQRHIGRMQAYREGFAILAPILERVGDVRQPDGLAPVEAWRAYGVAAMGALDEMTAGLRSLEERLSGERAIMRRDLSGRESDTAALSSHDSPRSASRAMNVSLRACLARMASKRRSKSAIAPRSSATAWRSTRSPVALS